MGIGIGRSHKYDYYWNLLNAIEVSVLHWNEEVGANRIEDGD